MEHTALNPFVPKISLYRTAAAIFELHIHLSSTVYASDVQITPHGNYFTISGALTPRVPMDSAGRLGRLMWTDQPCGRFGRDVNINLSPGTEYVVLQQLEEGHGYVIRYTIRNSRQVSDSHVHTLSTRSDLHGGDNLDQHVCSSHAPGISHSHNLTTPTIMSYNAFNLQQTNLENHDATLYNTIPATHMQHKNANHHSPVSLNQTRAQTHNHPHYYRASTSPKVHTLHALGAIDLNRGGITPEACGVSPAAFTETSPHSKIISINGSHPRDRASIPPVYTRAAGDIESIPTAATTFLTDIPQTSSGNGVGVQRVVEIPTISGGEPPHINVDTHIVTTPVANPSLEQKQIVPVSSNETLETGKSKAHERVLNASRDVPTELYGRPEALDVIVLPAGHNLPSSRSWPTGDLGSVSQPRHPRNIHAPGDVPESAGHRGSISQQQMPREVPSNVEDICTDLDMPNTWRKTIHSPARSADKVDLNPADIELSAHIPSVKKKKQSRKKRSTATVGSPRRKPIQTATETEIQADLRDITVHSSVPPDAMSDSTDSGTSDIYVSHARDSTSLVDTPKVEHKYSAAESRSLPHHGTMSNSMPQVDVSVKQQDCEARRDVDDFTTKQNRSIVVGKQPENIQVTRSSTDLDLCIKGSDAMGNKSPGLNAHITVFPAGPELATTCRQGMGNSPEAAQNPLAHRGKASHAPAFLASPSLAPPRGGIVSPRLPDASGDIILPMPQSEGQAQRVSTLNITKTLSNNLDSSNTPAIPNASISGEKQARISDMTQTATETLDLAELPVLSGDVSTAQQELLSVTDLSMQNLPLYGGTIVQRSKDAEASMLHTDEAIADSSAHTTILPEQRNGDKVSPFDIIGISTGHSSVSSNERLGAKFGSTPIATEQDPSPLRESNSPPVVIEAEQHRFDVTDASAVQDTTIFTTSLAQNEQVTVFTGMETGTIEKSDKATSRETVSGSTLSIIPGEDRGVEHSLDLSAVSAGPERATLSEPRSRAGVEVDMGQGSTQQIAFLCNPNMLSSTEVAAPNLHMTNRTGSRQTCSTESGSETRHQTALLVNQAPHLDGTQRIEQKTITGCSTQWTLQSSTVEERSDLISKVVIPGSSLISSSMMQGAQPTTKQAVPVSLRTEADKTFSTLTASKGKESSEAMAKRVLQAEDEVYDANVNAHIGMAEDMSTSVPMPSESQKQQSEMGVTRSEIGLKQQCSQLQVHVTSNSMLHNVVIEDIDGRSLPEVQAGTILDMNSTFEDQKGPDPRMSGSLNIAATRRLTQQGISQDLPRSSETQTIAAEATHSAEGWTSKALTAVFTSPSDDFNLHRERGPQSIKSNFLPSGEKNSVAQETSSLTETSPHIVDGHDHLDIADVDSNNPTRPEGGEDMANDHGMHKHQPAADRAVSSQKDRTTAVEDRYASTSDHYEDHCRTIDTVVPSANCSYPTGASPQTEFPAKVVAFPVGEDTLRPKDPSMTTPPTFTQPSFVLHTRGAGGPHVNSAPSFVHGTAGQAGPLSNPIDCPPSGEREQVAQQTSRTSIGSDSVISGGNNSGDILAYTHHAEQRNASVNMDLVSPAATQLRPADASIEFASDDRHLDHRLLNEVAPAEVKCHNVPLGEPRSKDEDEAVCTEEAGMSLTGDKEYMGTPPAAKSISGQTPPSPDTLFISAGLHLSTNEKTCHAVGSDCRGATVDVVSISVEPLAVIEPGQNGISMVAEATHSALIDTTDITTTEHHEDKVSPMMDITNNIRHEELDGTITGWDASPTDVVATKTEGQLLPFESSVSTGDASQVTAMEVSDLPPPPYDDGRCHADADHGRSLGIPPTEVSQSGAQVADDVQPVNNDMKIVHPVEEASVLIETVCWATIETNNVESEQNREINLGSSLEINEGVGTAPVIEQNASDGTSIQHGTVVDAIVEQTVAIESGDIATVEYYQDGHASSGDTNAYPDPVNTLSDSKPAETSADRGASNTSAIVENSSESCHVSILASGDLKHLSSSIEPAVYELESIAKTRHEEDTTPARGDVGNSRKSSISMSRTRLSSHPLSPEWSNEDTTDPKENTKALTDTPRPAGTSSQDGSTSGGQHFFRGYPASPSLPVQISLPSPIRESSSAAVD